MKLKEGATPYTTSRIQRLNFHEIEASDRTLQSLINSGILVEHNDEKHGPIRWLFAGQFVAKQGKPGDFRVVADFKPLNERTVKEVYDINTPDMIWRKVDPESEVFMVLDATNSYNQIRCSKETSRMMCVALPSKTVTRFFHFTTAGQGCQNSGPTWCSASDEVLKGIVGVHCVKGVDDLLL